MRPRLSLVSLLLAVGCGGATAEERAARDRAALVEAAGGRPAVALGGELVRGFSGRVGLADAPPEPGARAITFLTRYGGAFGIDGGPDPLRVTATRARAGGGHVVRVSRAHAGVPVFGAEAIVHLDGAGDVVEVVAAMPMPITIDLTPSRDPPAGGELVIVDHALFGDGGSGQALAWRARVTDAGGARDVLTDAHTGSPIVALEVDDEAGQSIKTCEGEGGACKTVWLTEAGPARAGSPPEAVARAHAFAVRAMARHVTGTGRASWDGKGTPVVVIVEPMSRRAFWRSETGSVHVRPNAVALDVIAHEIGHGVVRGGAPNLVSGGMAGAVNEGLADVFACLTDGNWTLAEDIGGGKRDLSVSRHARDLKVVPKAQWSRPANDMGHVHDNGRIVGHAFYLLTQGCAAAGGSIPADACARIGPGVGPDKALALAHGIVDGFLPTHAHPEDVARGARAVCKARLRAGAGWTVADCATVINAFHHVGLGPRDRDRDGVPDGDDNCSDIANPDQEPSAEDPNTGKACIHDDGSGAGAPTTAAAAGTFAVAVIEERGRRTAPMCGTSNDAMIEVTVRHTRRYLMMEPVYLAVHLDSARKRASNVGGPWKAGARRVPGGECTYGRLDLVKVDEIASGLSQAAAAALIKREIAGKPRAGSEAHTVAMPEHGTTTRIRAGDIRAR